MPLVRLVDVTFSYSDSVPILACASLQLGLGWTGVVGANGAGKSTLLKLLAGEIAPERGYLKFDPPGLSVMLCHQSAELRTDEIEALGLARDGVSRRVQGELRLDPHDLSRWPTLSPGERKRWQVGAALASQPGVLLLDEPTDHLDAEARELLRSGLCSFSGIGLIVSHDRAWRDELTDNTVRLYDGRMRMWSGSYSLAKRKLAGGRSRARPKASAAQAGASHARTEARRQAADGRQRRSAGPRA